MKPSDTEIINYYRTHSKPECCEGLGITLSDINTTLRLTHFSKVDAVKKGQAIDPRGEWYERNRRALTKELMTKLWPTWTIIGICRKYHVTEETVRKTAEKYGLPPKAPKKAKQEAMKSDEQPKPTRLPRYNKGEIRRFRTDGEILTGVVIQDTDRHVTFKTEKGNRCVNKVDLLIGTDIIERMEA